MVLLFPWLRHVFADGAYAGEKLETALAGLGQWTLEIVKRSDQAKGFEVLPRRWVVERTLGWFGRNRRLAKDFEATIASSEAWLWLASVQVPSAFHTVCASGHGQARFDHFGQGSGPKGRPRETLPTFW